MRKCALALSALLVTGCSIFGGDDEGSKPMELEDFSPSAKLESIWRSNAGAGREGVVKLQPLILGERIYTADVNGRLTAFNRDSGRRLWQTKTGDLIRGALGGLPGRLFYGTGNGEIVAVSDQDGDELWRRQLSGEVVSVPAAGDGRVAVQTLDGVLTMLDAQSGEPLWRYENPPPVLTLRGTASPLITSSAVIAGFASGKMMAFNPQNGLVLWEHRLALPKGRSEIEQMVDIDAAPLLVDSLIYTASFQGQAAALNRSNGRPQWKEEASTYGNLAVLNRTLFLTEANGRIRALSTVSGSQRWENESLLRRLPTGPEVIGDYVVVGDFDGYLHLLDPESGEFVARRRLDGSGISGPLIQEGGILYVLTDSGDLVALRAEPL